MKKRFSEQQIVGILREIYAGATAIEVGRRHAVHPNTIGAWRSKYAGMEASDVIHMGQLEDENSRLKRVVANLTLENDAIEDLLAKTSPALSADGGGEGLASPRSEPTPSLSSGTLPTAQPALDRSRSQR